MKWSVLFVYFTLSISLFHPIIRLPDDLDHAAFEGIVIDVYKNPIEGVSLTARHAITGAERSGISGEDGHYRLSMLTPGVYHLRVEARGFQTLRYEGIDAPAGTTVRRNIQLTPAVLEEQITIDASTDAPFVDTLRTALGGTLTRRQIDKLPVETRDPHDLIYTLTGSATPALSERELAEGDRENGFRRTPEEAGIFSLNGGTPFSNNLTIEALDNNDDRAARERISPAIHTVEEVQVITNQFSAEYGRASGGRVNLRLRSGTDRYRGMAFYNFRDESLNSNSFFRNADSARNRRLPFQNHNFGASVGGPIRRDRLFFFGAYEHDYIYDRTEIAALVPIATNPAFPLPAPNGANLGNSSLDRTGKTVLVNGGAEVGLYDQEVTTPRVAHILHSRIDL
ncbi:MAG: carboxypeptidase regulatory-like domain-containing protein, partial [Acidobacteria bacterium]|nr:carboxypeptidase regulatory-like domain-containing protein [Acidobacteriota bacterium]